MEAFEEERSETKRIPKKSVIPTAFQRGAERGFFFQVFALFCCEYVKQRALGYEPRGIPPDALFLCLEKLGELADKASSPELDEETRKVLKEITAAFLLPGKE